MVSPNIKVLTVDISHEKVFPKVKKDPHIEFMTCSSLAPEVSERILTLKEEYPGPVFAVIDSDHRKEHLLEEMKSLRPLLKKADYLVVEDGNINGHPVEPGWGEGPYEAILAYERNFPMIICMMK